MFDTNSANFLWTDFYSEFATSLLKFANDRVTLIRKIQEIYVNTNMKLPTLEKDDNIIDIDPFTVFGLFNKGISNENRIAIMKQVKILFNIASSVPTSFDGIPLLNNMSATFYYFSGDRGENDIDNLWDLLHYAISYADEHNNEANFIKAFDTVTAQKGVSWNITMGLYWIRPFTFINLDARNRKLLKNNQSRFKPDIDVTKTLKKMVSAEKYLLLMKKIKEIMSEYNNFPELSFYAWKTSFKDIKESGVYWPSPEEYDPQISEAEWMDILNDRDITTIDTLRMLKMILMQGGESTCANLAEKYGNTHNHYNKLGSNFGERVKKALDCPDCIDDGQVRFFPIPFLGRYITENGNNRYSWKLRDELKAALENTDLSDIDLTAKEELKMNISKNTILYGPPGTGKTYNTVLYAVATIENKNLSEVKAEEYNDVLSRYNEYKSEGLIEFTTFHQSYGYEEFIEGIKPETKDNVVTFRVADGVFKKFCNDTVNNEHAFDLAWSKLVKQATNQEEKYDFPRRKELSNNNEDLKTEYYNIGTSEGFTVKRQNSENKLNKQLIYREWLEDRFHSGDVPPNGTGWLIKSYRTILEEMIKHYGLPEHPSDNSNRVFIIDEINRGNISKIFGELITLIEPTKRIGQTEGMKIKLPYSQTMFGVPDNVYILGTMNTADRSIAAIDTALRRRFRFKEIMPDVDVLNGITVEGVIIKNMLDKINKRITALYDREHTIGHSYFLPLKDNPTLDTLAVIFSDDIIPLLQEYFYEDYEKIRLVLGDNKKSVDDTNRFIIATQNDYNELFGNTEGFDDSFSYEINNEAFYNIEAYRKI